MVRFNQLGDKIFRVFVDDSSQALGQPEGLHLVGGGDGEHGSRDGVEVLTVPFA